MVGVHKDRGKRGMKERQRKITKKRKEIQGKMVQLLAPSRAFDAFIVRNFTIVSFLGQWSVAE